MSLRLSAFGRHAPAPSNDESALLRSWARTVRVRVPCNRINGPQLTCSVYTTSADLMLRVSSSNTIEGHDAVLGGDRLTHVRAARRDGRHRAAVKAVATPGGSAPNHLP
jgi:hypothetical protein